MVNTDDILALAQHGIGGAAFFSPILHAGVGTFFALSGYHKLTDASRHAALVETFKRDKVPFLRFNQWWVPGWELVGGACLTFSVFPAFMAAVLCIICLVAALCEGPSRVAEYHPIDKADAIDDYLYLPEVIYGMVLGAIVMGA